MGPEKFLRRSGGSNDAVHGPLGTRLSRPVRVDGQVGRRVNPSPRIGAGAIRGNKQMHPADQVGRALAKAGRTDGERMVGGKVVG